MDPSQAASKSGCLTEARRDPIQRGKLRLIPANELSMHAGHESVS